MSIDHALFLKRRVNLGLVNQCVVMHVGHDKIFVII